MNKWFRIAIASVLLLGILILARNTVAWAGVSLNTNNVVGQSQPAVQNAAADPGTVKPPPVVVPPITKPGTYPVGGVCTLFVEQLVSTDSIHAKLLPFDVLNGGRPQDTSRYLAGVCDLAYHVSGKLEPELPPGDGTVKICFAALPNITSKIYVYADKTWTALDTTLENGMECATASKTGRYVLAQSNP